MKNIAKLLLLAALTSSVSSCESFLDINQNPNQLAPENISVDFILAQALKVTGDLYGNTLNTYGSWTAGYWAKTGTVNGYNEERTYNYSSAYQQGLWGGVYDNLQDYDLIEKNAVAQSLPYHAAIATIMKVHGFQTLVDQYGDIPYTEALQASTNITPKYDKAADIYRDFSTKLETAVAAIKAVPAGTRPPGAEDILFGGNMTNWVRLANTLRLRILLRQSFVPELDAYVRAEMTKLQNSPDGFLTIDAQVQPGYLQTAGKQNPFWNRYRATAAGITTQSTERNYQAGTQYIIDQYVNNKDPRVSQLYVLATSGAFANSYKGVVLGDPAPLPGGTQISRWKDFGGILKGYDAPTPLLLAAESYFLQAEAKSRGFLNGGDAGAKTDFNSGIRASFVYFYTPAPSQAASTNNVSSTAVPNYNTYLAANATNPLVNWDLTTVSKLEKIIYQKYLAMNSVTGIEAWNEYRRTAFPKFPASLQSSSPRADKLPVRLLYPQTEVNTNFKNIPAGINQFSSKIFWDVVD